MAAITGTRLNGPTTASTMCSARKPRAASDDCSCSFRLGYLANRGTCRRLLTTMPHRTETVSSTRLMRPASELAVPAVGIAIPTVSTSPVLSWPVLTLPVWARGRDDSMARGDDSADGGDAPASPA